MGAIKIASTWVNQTQNTVPGGIAEIRGVHQDLKGAAVVISTTSALNSPIGPVQKTAGPWRMTADYCEHNQVETLVVGVRYTRGAFIA